ncbi:MAG: hypothetical protein JSU90_02810 [Nitrospiraceae bacterium]|nr:MAG: hypothetical protein JSU90_02810 [Nitrospiraceae bacterium]
MKYIKAIGLIAVMAVLFSFPGTGNGVTMGPSSGDEQGAAAKTYVEVKCDPCDYNIDYGASDHRDEKGGVDEGAVKLDCDPCDYNIDYGGKDRPAEK